MKTHKIRVSEPCSMLKRTIEVSVSSGKKNNKKVTVVIPNIKQNDDGSFDVLPIDQFSGAHFMLNDCGFPMNDIMAYEDTQNESIARAVLSRIHVIDNGKPENLSLQEQFDNIVPSNWSSPAEYLSLHEKFARIAFDRSRSQSGFVSAVVQDDSKPDKPDNVVNVDPE